MRLLSGEIGSLVIKGTLWGSLLEVATGWFVEKRMWAPAPWVQFWSSVKVKFLLQLWVTLLDTV